VDLGGGVSLELVWIPAGSFTMGSPDNESGRYDDEGPQHKVTISKGFWMGKTEVTQRQYLALMGRNPSYFKNAGQDAPVEMVTWNDAKSFCGKLQSRLPPDLRGLTARLPMEAEWEYACRSGTTTALYTGGLTIRGENNGPELDAIAWYGGNSEVRYEGGYDSSGWSNKQYDHKRAGTQLVGRKQPNAWGLYDMLGNVWEWCEDSERGYTASAQTDPEGSGSSRVLRGGSWHNYARNCRSAIRRSFGPGLRSINIGFRVVLR
jgi:formylglycine-generating enzyme required for sulfatase activity